MQKIKTGIYGGSFNPIHNGHIAIAKRMLELAGLDEIWLIVSPQNPLKTVGSLLDDRLRLEMTQRALAPYPQLTASDYEFRLPKPSYTWNTLQHLKADHPGCQFTLIIGADNWLSFSRWARPDYILSNCDIAVYARPDCDIDTATLPHNVRLYDTKLYEISSTKIRDNVKRGLPITGMVPSRVEGMVKEAYGA